HEQTTTNDSNSRSYNALASKPASISGSRQSGDSTVYSAITDPGKETRFDWRMLNACSIPLTRHRTPTRYIFYTNAHTAARQTNRDDIRNSNLLLETGQRVPAERYQKRLPNEL